MASKITLKHLAIVLGICQDVILAISLPCDFNENCRCTSIPRVDKMGREVMLNVDCSNRRLKDIPYLPSNVYTLSLQKNNIKVINGYQFSHLRNLSELDISCNKITRLNILSFNGLSNLLILNLNNNPVPYTEHAIPNEVFKSLVSLIHLSIIFPHCHVTDFLPEVAVSNLKLLESLEIDIPMITPYKVVFSKSFDSLVHLETFKVGGPCRAGKSILASVLIGEEIPLKWSSTDGLVIFFGRNGIDIERNKMVPLKEGDRGHEVLAKMLRGKPEQSHDQLTRQKTKSNPIKMNSIVQTGINTYELPIENTKEDYKITKYSLDQFPNKADVSMTISKLKPLTILKHWVDSILTYTENSEDIMLMILFAATHRDKCKAKTPNSVHDIYLVPCIIKAPKPFGFNTFESQIQRTICLRYSLSLQSIPSALAYKVLSATLNAWPLKAKNRTRCLYHKAEVLNVNEENEIRICLEDSRVLISLANQQSLLDISPDIAASIQECLTKNL
ncbi:unnamed protein product [Mytilus coruscus]|uniref:Uncharacterized protein n=1 Tax=Mytilus coruscus TaxID=42192 RepID=A0A6J8AGP0_MYTCO|nr:unnamed protein product [Mytilus coruscus]